MKYVAPNRTIKIANFFKDKILRGLFNIVDLRRYKDTLFFNMYKKINNFSTILHLNMLLRLHLFHFSRIIEVKCGFWEKFCFECSEKITIFAALFKENKL